MVSKIFKYFFTFTGNIKTTLIKIISISFYGFLFFYNIYQTLEYSYLLYSIKDTLYKKIHNLNIFIKEVSQLSKEAKTHIQHFIKTNSINETLNISNNFPSIYRLWKDNKLKDKISNLLANVYVVDILNAMSKQLYKYDWSICNYTQDNTKIWNMKNPILSSKQVSNPVNLSKNIIMTGPNAAGKTTYVKSILSNIILAQTFGIVNALKADICLYDNIISFMRITDVLGSKSYFEAEAEYCMRMMQKAKYLSDNNMKGLFLMDEPMHSTPPTEGMATAYAVAEYIGKLKGATVILTTHFHKLVLLEKEYPQYFVNLSVEAHKQADGTFYFPYKISRGYSYQCIAIELLLSKEFPEEVIISAINMKNKICSELVDKSKDVFN
jgi:DNA mismatch repair ATPase MutS